MHSIVDSWYVSLLMAFTSNHTDGARFSAVTVTADSHQRRIYLQEWNQDPPSKVDPANRGAPTRHQICEEISHSGAFMHYESYPLDTSELDSAEAPNSPSKLHRTREYANSSFQLQRVQMTAYDANLEPMSIFRREYVFVCLVEYEASSEEDSNEHSSAEENSLIHPLYVSKLYNVDMGLHAHRFIFLRSGEEHHVMLVEGSAEAQVRPDFNVELHYLELRRHHFPGLSCDRDPVCRLNREPLDANQTFRLCAIVLTSVHFKEEDVEYPLSVNNPNEWERREVSFRTEEGVERARAKRFRRYYEFMVRCRASMIDDGRETAFYTSRAYNPYEVFVYELDPVSRKFYLKNLSTNVSIERNDFGWTWCGRWYEYCMRFRGEYFPAAGKPWFCFSTRHPSKVFGLLISLLSYFDAN